MYVYDCKIKHYFPIKQTFSGKYAILESTFNIQRRKTGFRSRKKKSGLRFRFNHVYIHAFITSIKHT